MVPTEELEANIVENKRSAEMLELQETLCWPSLSQLEPGAYIPEVCVCVCPHMYILLYPLHVCVAADLTVTVIQSTLLIITGLKGETTATSWFSEIDRK